MAVYRILLVSFLFSCAIFQLLEHSRCDLDAPLVINYGKASDNLNTLSRQERTKSLQETQQTRSASISVSAIISYIKHSRRKQENGKLLKTGIPGHFFDRYSPFRPVGENASCMIPDGLNSYLVRFIRC